MGMSDGLDRGREYETVGQARGRGVRSQAEPGRECNGVERGRE